jgi:hypothetical protein
MLTRRDILRSAAGLLASFVCIEEPSAAKSPACPPKTWLRRLPDLSWEALDSCQHLHVGDMVRILGDESVEAHIAFCVREGPFSPEVCTARFGAERQWGWGVTLDVAKHESAKVSQEEIEDSFRAQLRAARAKLEDRGGLAEPFTRFTDDNEYWRRKKLEFSQPRLEPLDCEGEVPTPEMLPMARELPDGRFGLECITRNAGRQPKRFRDVVIEQGEAVRFIKNGDAWDVERV